MIKSVIVSGLLHIFQFLNYSVPLRTWTCYIGDIFVLIIVLCRNY